MTPPTDDQIKAIDSLLEEIYQQQCLTKAVLKERNTVVENLEQFLKKIIPGNNRGWNVLITITGLQSTIKLQHLIQYLKYCMKAFSLTFGFLLMGATTDNLFLFLMHVIAVILCTRFKTNNYLSPQFMEYKKDHNICR
jgi:hypothetical protein